MKRYGSLMKRKPGQEVEGVFADFTNETSAREPGPVTYQRLTGNTGVYTVYDTRHQYPVLTTYLNQTFLRAQEKQQILYSIDGLGACFSTGLHTKQDKDIYALFAKNKTAEKDGFPDWIFLCFANCYL